MKTIRGWTSSMITGQRFIGLDGHRGFIMVLMPIDHASYFIARVHRV